MWLRMPACHLFNLGWLCFLSEKRGAETVAVKTAPLVCGADGGGARGGGGGTRPGAVGAHAAAARR